MRILGIDPSTVSTGWAIIDEHKTVVDCGAICPNKKMDEQEKIKYVYDEICNVIRDYSPTNMACEDQFARLNPKTLKILSRLVGSVLLAGEQNNLKVTLYAPTHVKSVFSGIGNATKEQMIEKAREYTIRELCSDEADAIGVAITLMEELK
ncbi:MAG TPA: crossover junction endodeoxyribonuclease RuvC [Pseudoneobacillus sp.]|jgi:crossover junction endodeoxyribonuclease RuvC|nr:crossover junction endodeoxyribonuclease RuvC [Pseudoneobacillus sp.]